MTLKNSSIVLDQIFHLIRLSCWGYHQIEHDANLVLVFIAAHVDQLRMDRGVEHRSCEWAPGYIISYLPSMHIYACMYA